MEVVMGMDVEKMVATHSPDSPQRQFLGGVMEKMKVKAVGLATKMGKIGKDDPRRIFHAMKVGFALTVVSLFYYVNPIYDGFGVSVMWAVLTTVVVMEYTVGATLSKGVNRAFGTLLAGALGLGAHHLAVLSGGKAEPVLLVFFVFLISAAGSFTRFIPEVKARYDHGTLTFILTFSLVAVSSYRVDELLELAHQRLSTIVIGGVTCVCISVFVFPVWAGEELHELAANNLEKLATYLEGLSAEYFGQKEGLEKVHVKEKSFSQAYKPVLNSKSTEESLANFARWEPPHGRFGFRHPWKQYLKLGTLSRRCAYYIEVLNAHATKCENPILSTEFYEKTMSARVEMCSELGKSLRELANSVRNMIEPTRASQHITNSLAAIESLKHIMVENDAVFGILHEASVVSLLVEIASSTREIAASMEDLSRLAKFKSVAAHQQKPSIKPVSDDLADSLDARIMVKE